MFAGLIRAALLVSQPVAVANANGPPFRYFRLRTTATGAGSGVSLAEFVAATSAGGANTLLGKTATATSVFDTPYTAAMAVDGDLSTIWNSDFSNTWPQDLTVDLGASSGGWITPYEFRLVPRTGATSNQSPGDFTIAGSVDGTTWTTLITRTGQTYLTDQTSVVLVV
jgi:hypothetical protein